jgi:hypothetical protein
MKALEYKEYFTDMHGLREKNKSLEGTQIFFSK